MDIHEFVQSLRAAKVYTQKQCVVIENLYIYFKDSKVYKVIVSINPDQSKKAKKLGITRQYTTTFLDDIPIKTENFKEGSFIAIYNVNNGDCSIFEGEVTEDEQMKRIKRPLPS